MQTGTGLQQFRGLCPTVSVGVLTADLMNLGQELSTIEQAGVRVLHIDIMDGCFCPMLTVGPSFVKAIKTSLFKDVHLMIEAPIGKLADFVSAGADMITVQMESTKHVHRVFQQLASMRNANDPQRGIIRGAALNPGTSLTVLEPVLNDIEMVLLLAVNPGWSGQKFAPETAGRVDRLKRLLEESGRGDVLIAVDGGITRENVETVAKLGVDMVVAGSAVFDGKAVADNAACMLRAVRR